MIKVKAKAQGYFGALRNPGDVFHIESMEQLGSWMELVDKEAASKQAKAPAKAAGKAPAKEPAKEVVEFDPETASDDQLKEWLTAAGVAYSAEAPKEALQQLVAETQAANA